MNWVRVAAVPALLLFPLASMGCGVELRQRLLGVRSVIAEARENGAYRCAPRELAMAESHADFTDDELVYGNHLGALDELAIADQNARSAFDLSPREKCNPKKVVVTDRDKDGVLDKDDACPDDPGPALLHGCPDTDKDGVLDKDDRCVMRPGPKENQGCPWPDSDGDGVLDRDDNCPKVPGPKENKGCPDGDRDGDKVVDRLDRCPDVFGDPDNEGCPRYKNIVVRDDKIELRQKVLFATDKFQILGGSFEMLGEVADVLSRRPSVQIRIEGHTDSRASRKHNMKLSQARADSVKRYLVNRGIDAARMDAVGFGPDRPIDDNRSTVGRENNRRVEFLITKQ